MAQTHFEQEEKGYKTERVVEAALFMLNKVVKFDELTKLTNTSEEELLAALEALKHKYEETDRALEVSVNLDEKVASLQVKAKWLPAVAQLSSKVELHRKSMKILALIAKKGELMQSDLRKYFKGDIYEYVGELREKQYLERHKIGHTWKLKPTKKFHEEFQISEIGKTEPKEETKEEVKETEEAAQ